ncbi:hypothetical protein EYF80_040257 [Liparis tanakae]|uniref:Uncharacterized protein n=1 Tax=Liparis tanakae TaxID=230148 RepID=A0A4Z2G7R6_9TELE|nr:hypothetical protein EYF80_040257 [Liparis tanakae]
MAMSHPVACVLIHGVSAARIRPRAAEGGRRLETQTSTNTYSSERPPARGGGRSLFQSQRRRRGAASPSTDRRTRVQSRAED